MTPYLEGRSRGIRDGRPRSVTRLFWLRAGTIARPVVSGVNQDKSLARLGGWRKRVTLDGGDLVTSGPAAWADHNILTGGRGGLPWPQRLLRHQNLRKRGVQKVFCGFMRRRTTPASFCVVFIDVQEPFWAKEPRRISFNALTSVSETQRGKYPARTAADRVRLLPRELTAERHRRRDSDHRRIRNMLAFELIGHAAVSKWPCAYLCAGDISIMAYEISLCVEFQGSRRILS